MKYKDTLALFDELIASGTPEPQARAQAKQLGEIGNALEDLNFTLREYFAKIDKDLMWMKIIGGAMTAAFLSNGLFGWLAK